MTTTTETIEELEQQVEQEFRPTAGEAIRRGCLFGEQLDGDFIQGGNSCALGAMALALHEWGLVQTGE